MLTNSAEARGVPRLDEPETMLKSIEILTDDAMTPRAQEMLRDAVRAEFPTIAVTFAYDVADADVGLDDFFDDSFDSWAFDTRCDAREGAWTLRVAATGQNRRELQPALLAVLTRCQRLMARRDDAGRGAVFDRVLGAHRRLHDLSKPLVVADYRHSLDVWQWLFRLTDEPSFHLQCAALFHDIERLTSEPDFRVEHLAQDYQRFKDAHAAGGAEIVRSVLARCGASAAEVDASASLVARHERPQGDEEVALLNDADALSFFSMNSSGYADYFGPEQAMKKVEYTWNRMRPAARTKLASVRLRSDVAAMVARVRGCAPASCHPELPMPRRG